MILAALLLTCCANAPITAPDEASVETEVIVLGDLIPFPPGDPRASIALGYAPNPGLSRRIARPEIVSRIQSAGYATDDVTLPPSILVRRLAGALDHGQTVQAIYEALSWHYPGASVDVTSVELPAVPIPAGPVDLTASLPARFDPAAPIFVRLEIRGEGFSRNAFVRTHARIEQEQPVLKRRIAAHSPVAPSDIEWRLAPVRGEIPEQFEGMLAKRTLDPGAVLTSDLFYMPLYVQRGETVTVTAAAGGISIAATMRAKAAGRYGDTIQVEHLFGGGFTTARIVGPRMLETIQGIR